MGKKEKYKTFLQVAGLLNRRYKITPVLYGSLGLQKCIGGDFEINDIDILVPQKYLKELWPDLQKLMIELGYCLSNEHEHEFSKDGETVAFGRIKGLDNEAKVDSSKLKVESEDGARFMVLQSEDYRKAYEYCLKDGYCRAKRGAADQQKIDLIYRYLDEW